jgi:hypothetical protein
MAGTRVASPDGPEGIRSGLDQCAPGVVHRVRQGAQTGGRHDVFLGQGARVLAAQA